MIIDLKRSIDIRWLFDPVLSFILRRSCFLLQLNPLYMRRIWHLVSRIMKNRYMVRVYKYNWRWEIMSSVFFMVCIIPHSPTSNLEREVVCIKASQDQIFRQSFIPCCLFLQKLSGDCQLHQKYSCWLCWIVDYHQVRLLLSESNVLVNSAPFRSANIIQH